MTDNQPTVDEGRAHFAAWLEAREQLLAARVVLDEAVAAMRPADRACSDAMQAEKDAWAKLLRFHDQAYTLNPGLPAAGGSISSGTATMVKAVSAALVRDVAGLVASELGSITALGASQAAIGSAVRDVYRDFGKLSEHAQADLITRVYLSLHD